MSKREELYQAMDNNNLNGELGVKYLIDSDDLEIKGLFFDKNECDQLLYAAGAENNYVEIVDELLNKMSYFIDFAVTTLSYACKKGHYDVVTRLFETKAVTAKILQNDATPLSNACYNGNLKLVQYLINQGANLDQHSDVAISNACAMGHIDIVEELVKCGGKIKSFDAAENNPYVAAINNKQGAMFIYLVANTIMSDNETIALLPAICEADDTNMLDSLLKNNHTFVELGALSEEVHKQLLLSICNKDSVNLFQKRIIKKGLLFDIPLTASNSYPLHLASSLGHNDLVELLLANKADSNHVTSDSETALHLACQNGHVDIVEQLLMHDNSNIDHQTSPLIHFGFHFMPRIDPYSSNTALTLVLKSIHNSAGMLGIVDRLIMYGANCELPNGKNQTPLEIAINNKQMDIIHRLLNNGINLNVLIDDKTPLIAALRNIEDPIYLREIINLLHQFGADVNLANSERRPLHVAICRGDIKAMRCLLNLGANVELCCREGFTPLTAVIHDMRHNPSIIEAIDLLIEFKADVNQPEQNTNAITPLRLAALFKKANIVNHLLKFNPSEKIKVLNNAIKNGLVDKNCDCTYDYLWKDKKPSNRFEYRYSPQHLEVIDLLLMFLKTDINDKIYSGGLTVLMIWTLNGNLQIVERLLQHPDIDTTIKTKKGHTAAELVNDQRDDIKQLFQAHEEKLAEISSSSSRPSF